MSNQYFTGFSDDQQAEYQKYAEEHWDSKLVRQSANRWNALTADEKKALLKEGERITLAIARSMPKGVASTLVQVLIAEWHHYINRFYDCSDEILLALGQSYVEQPEFNAFYTKIDPALPRFLSESITIYVKARQKNSI